MIIYGIYLYTIIGEEDTFVLYFYYNIYNIGEWAGAVEEWAKKFAIGYRIET